MSAPSHDDSNKWRSTWPQRAWTLAGTAAIISSFLTCTRLLAASSSTTTELLAAAAAAFVGYSLADLATGVYHWLIDNNGDTATPVIGGQVASFLDHHRRPYAITRLEPCNLLHTLAAFVAVALPAAGTALSALGGAPAAAHAFACAFAACGMLSVKFHAWAHETRPAKLPPGVAVLQAGGVLVSRAKHAGHHRPPHNSNYCSVSGMWNPVLDRFRAFQKLELIYLGTGVRPRWWDEVDGARPPWSSPPAASDDGEHQLR